MTAPAPLVPVGGVTSKEGKEKTAVVAVIGIIGGVLTAGSTFFTPDSTAGHIITAGLGLLTLLGTTLGVYVTPNSKVYYATVAAKGAVDAGMAAVIDVREQWPDALDDGPDLLEGDALEPFTPLGDLDGEPDEQVGAHRA